MLEQRGKDRNSDITRREKEQGSDLFLEGEERVRALTRRERTHENHQQQFPGKRFVCLSVVCVSTCMLACSHRKSRT